MVLAMVVTPFVRMTVVKHERVQKLSVLCAVKLVVRVVVMVVVAMSVMMMVAVVVVG